MATFLELVQDLARDTGTLAGGVNLSTVTGATGRADKLVSWVNKAWRNIQNEQRDWLWMRDEFEGTLFTGVTRYTPASFNIDARFGEWNGCISVYDAALGQQDETYLEEISYALWRHYYDYRTHDAQRPIHWAVAPNGDILVGPSPKQNYVIRGEYQKSPQTLVANDDIPEMPVKFHDLIVWEAQRLLDKADGDHQMSSADVMEVVALRAQLKREQLEEVTLGHGEIE